MTNQNEKISIEFKNLIMRQYKGIQDAYINNDGFFNVICKSKKVALTISHDLGLAGLKTVHFSSPNVYSKSFHLAASRAA